MVNSLGADYKSPEELTEPNKAKDLKSGEFLQQYGSKVTLEKVPLFRSLTKPQLYIEPQKPKKPNLIQRIIRAVIEASKYEKNDQARQCYINVKRVYGGYLHHASVPPNRSTFG